MKTQMQNLKLLEQAKNGDTRAFGEIYDLFADRLFRYIRFKIQDNAQAEDILQEAFIRAWRGMPTFKISTEANLAGWLYKITQNVINDHLRKVYRAPDLVELDENLPVFQSGSDQSDLDREILIKAVKKAFEFLPPQYKQILELRYVQDLTVPEVSKITGKSALAVRLAQHRALKQLRKVLGKNYAIGFEKI